MDTPEHDPANGRRRKSDSFQVLDDLAAMPVTEAEIDAVEGFLLAAFHAVMAGENVEIAKTSDKPDSKPPQTRDQIRVSLRRRKR